MSSGSKLGFVGAAIGLIVLPGGLAAGQTTVAAAAEVAAGPLRYAFESLPGEQPGVRVTLEVQAPRATPSVFNVQPHWGGEEHVEQEVQRLDARGATGNSLKIEQDAAQPHRWTVAHAPGETVLLSYLIQPPTDRINKDSNQYRPILTDDLFHFIGEVGLIAPDWIPDEQTIPIELTWRGFAAAGWRVVTSFGIGDETRRVDQSISAFRHSLFLAGKADRLRIEERRIGDGRLAVAVYSDQWSFGPPEFADLAERIVRVEREFFNDFEDPYFLITLIPTADTGPQSYSLGGTGLTNCFALFCSPNTTLDPRSPNRFRALHLLAHEYFHTWNGLKMMAEEPDAHLYWFSEGFTDFYAVRLLYNGGLITPEQWVERTNDDLRTYWTSPVRDADAARIEADFWNDRDVQKLPYARGHALALAIDWEMRRRSAGERSLDHFMRETYRDLRSSGTKLNPQRLIERIATATSPEFAEKIRAVAMDGALLELPPDLLSPAIAFEMKPTSLFRPGFDVSASLRDKKVTGVEPDGPAAAAGLRNGQAIKGVSIHHGDVSKPIELTVEDGAEQREVKFMPHGPEISIPTLRLVSPPKF